MIVVLPRLREERRERRAQTAVVHRHHHEVVVFSSFSSLVIIDNQGEAGDPVMPQGVVLETRRLRHRRW